VIARVQGLVGVDAVRVPERGGGRSPEEQVLCVVADRVDLDRAHIDAVRLASPWPGALPGPAPTRLHRPPLPAEVVDAQGHAVCVDGRSLLSAEPHRICIAGRVWEDIDSWAGPWPLDEWWWDSGRQRRKARFQFVASSGTARLVVIEGGQWWLEATYD
jgi:protein ImuB